MHHPFARDPARKPFTLILVAGLGFCLAACPAPGSAVWAADHADGSDHDSGQKGKGGSASHAGGHDTDAEGHETDGHETDGHDAGTDDHSDHEGGSKGGSKGKSGSNGQNNGQANGKPGNARDGAKGNRPVWAAEGIPEVELGRLNVARSPDRVLDRAYAEALGGMTPQVLAFYARDLDGMILQLSQNWDEASFIDSPLQNLALLREALAGPSVLQTEGINQNNATLMAAFLGTASDKTIPITPNTALALSILLDHPLTAGQAATLAAQAEKIRLAILAGHG